MKICLLEHHDIPYPIVGYGSTQRISQYLYEGLVKAGHEVILICGESNSYHLPGSRIVPLPIYDILDLLGGKIRLMDVIGQQVDIFQTHVADRSITFDFAGFDGQWVSTCHNLDRAGAPDQIFVSKAQLQFIVDFFTEKKFHNAYICYNGVDTESLVIKDSKREKLVWLGAISRQKGVHYMVEVAKKLKEKIYLAGTISEKPYFKECVEPFLGKELEYIGELKTDEEKINFFADARAYIHTSCWCEPFGMAPVEAQACGLPAFMFDCGSAYEINAMPFLVCKSVNEMVEKIQGLPSDIDRQSIRKEMVENFSKRKMVQRYIGVYGEITAL